MYRKPTSENIKNLLKCYKGCNERIIAPIGRFLINYYHKNKVCELLSMDDKELTYLLKYGEKNYYNVQFNHEKNQIEVFDMLKCKIEKTFGDNSQVEDKKPKVFVLKEVESQKPEKLKKKTKKSSKFEGLTKEEEELLHYVWDNQGLTTKEISEYCNLPMQKAYRMMKKIEEKTILIYSEEQNSEGYIVEEGRRNKTQSLFWRPISMDYTIEEYLEGLK
ncbi:MAG: hypothetical protein ACTSR3_00970 [Candidatus Helarchaeota archaeon]